MLVKYNSDVGRFDGLTKDKVYMAEDFSDEQYLIRKNDLGSTSKISKEKFIIIRE